MDPYPEGTGADQTYLRRHPRYDAAQKRRGADSREKMLMDLSDTFPYIFLVFADAIVVGVVYTTGITLQTGAMIFWIGLGNCFVVGIVAYHKVFPS